MIVSDESRFWAKVDRSAGTQECWPWTASTNAKGYGYFSRDGSNRSITAAHRVALELGLGRRLIPGELACHHCDRPGCCNPSHLYAGSAATNAADMVARHRHREHGRNHCHRGHPWTPESTYTRPDGYGRACRICNAQRARDRRASQRKETA